MSAEPVQVEDPSDPVVILRDLPEQERGEFLRQYHEAVDTAHDPAGYRRLQQLLYAWRLTVIATSRRLLQGARGRAKRHRADDASRGSDPGRGGAAGGGAGLTAVTYRAGLVTYVIDDACQTVTLTDVTWAG
jgi:hypothetical protein